MNVWNATDTYPKWAITQHSNALYYSLQASNTGHSPVEAASAWWAAYVDPIGQMIEALWTLLEAHAPLTSMVKTGNRIKYTGENRDPEKRQIADADLPELRIVPVGSTPHPLRTSSSSTIVKRFRVEVSTGDQRIDAGLTALEWEVYRALVNWFNTLAALTWKDHPYVKQMKTNDVKDGKSQRDLERGIHGWAAVWECEVEMWFQTSDLALE